MHYVLHIKYDPEIWMKNWMIYTHEERNDAFPGCIYTDNVNLWWIYDAFPGCIYTDNVNLWFNNISS